MKKPFPFNLGYAIGFALAFTASIGVFAAYYFGHGNPQMFNRVLGASFLLGLILGWPFGRAMVLEERLQSLSKRLPPEDLL